MPKNNVAIVTVNYNCSDETLGAFESLKPYLRKGDEVIVVDNCSNEEEQQILNSQQKLTAPGFKLILNEKNAGYGMACDIGIKASIAEFIFLLNPDCRIQKLDLSAWIELFKAENLAALAPQIRYPGGQSQPNGGGPTKPLTYFLQLLSLGALFRWVKGSNFTFLLAPLKYLPGSVFKSYLKSHQSGEQFQSFDWLSGAALFFKKSDYLKVGGFDPNIFLYNEDEDLCFRLRQLGKLLRDNEQIVIHSQGVTLNVSDQARVTRQPDVSDQARDTRRSDDSDQERDTRQPYVSDQLIDKKLQLEQASEMPLGQLPVSTQRSLGKGRRSRLLSNLYILKKRGFWFGALLLKCTYLLWYSFSSLFLLLTFELEGTKDRLKLVRDLILSHSTEARD